MNTYFNLVQWIQVIQVDIKKRTAFLKSELYESTLLKKNIYLAASDSDLALCTMIFAR